MGQPLYCSAANAGSWGERGYGDCSTPYGGLSSITLLPWLPGFPPQAFPPTIASPHNLLPHIPSIHLSTVNSTPCPGIAPQSLNFKFPPNAPSREPTSLSQVGMAVASTVLILIPFRCHSSVVSVSALNVSLLTQTIAPMLGLDPCFTFPTH